ncbi:uncharacterized protein LOC122505429 [Leptopilina heterotoma]|uniref:uncharacterized protein LOC122505429 n=1 Tax=Leptopilina heterotoma TaxID=63436 RepID=UPI001CA9F7E1|nr:uncharacterized protein LOC122505429 [Leptopilina heterotoma]
MESRAKSTTESDKEVPPLNMYSHLNVQNLSEVLLSTALIDIIDNEGKSHVCRVLLDSGSQPNLLTKDLADRLKLKKRKLESSVEVINSQQLSCNEWNLISLYFLKLLIWDTGIAGYIPSNPINKKILNIPDRIQLADPYFDRPATIDALIGGDLFYDLLLTERVKLALPRTMLQNSHLGWIVTGRVGCAQGHKGLKSNLIRDPLDNLLQKLWEIEHLEDKQHLSSEEEECERHFSLNIGRDEDGRYVTHLPFNEKVQDLGSNFELARKRFFAMELRLDKNKNLRDQYNSFMKQYEDLGRMVRLPFIDKKKYFIPHHAIFKENDSIIKFRVVFDRSADSDSGLSLNDVLQIGPNIQDGIFEIILRFRKHIFLFSGDIEKMYRQFLIHPEDCRYQLILWRASSREPLQAFQLRTVTYGTSAAPYLATRCLKQLAIDEEEDFPDAAEVLRDDLVELVGKAGLQLRKWTANDERLLQGLPNCGEKGDQQLCKDQVNKMLGVAWNSVEDAFQCKVNVKPMNDLITKRSILAQINELYDPLGLLAPVIVYGKMLLQDLWRLNIGWDNHVPDELSSVWRAYRDQLNLTSEWKLPRSIKVTSSNALQLHGFADASEKAYGACFYVRASNDQHTSSVLLCAKSRVALVKKITIPRLELCVATLLVKLLKTVISTINLQFSKIILWSDSTIVLNWIKTSPRSLQTFVANRVSEIQSVDQDVEWKHVPTKDNPADLISRELWKRISSLNGLIRFVALCLRFIKKWRTKSISTDSFVEEHRNALKRIIQLIQHDEFHEEMKALNNEREVSTRSTIFTLNPFVEDDTLQGESEKIEVGRLVVLREENLPPLRWLLGRIAEVHPGDDGVIRVVTVRGKRCDGLD